MRYTNRVVQCDELYKMPFDSNGRHATGNAITLEDGRTFLTYYDDVHDDEEDLDFSHCRHFWETEEGDFVPKGHNHKLTIIDEARLIFKQYYRGLRTWEQVVSGFADLGISEMYIPNWHEEIYR